MGPTVAIKPTEIEAGPGRFCPADYRLGAEAFLATPWRVADCLYVAGGLYGNTVALKSLLALFARESSGACALVFNGDFHWFDRDPAEFACIETLTAPHLRLRGNVETELARTRVSDDDEIGCGCAYPDDVPQGVVERSNTILRLLRRTALAVGDAAQLGLLPMVARFRVGDVGVAITHGDDQSLAGWRLAHDRLEASWAQGLGESLDAIGARVLASSHTCMAVADARSFLTDARRWQAVINNGAAGLGNFMGWHAGLVTRIALADRPMPPEATEVYALHRDGVRISALAIDFPLPEWLERFDAQWPVASEAAMSYRERVIAGTDWRPADAARGDFRLRPSVPEGDHATERTRR